MHTENEQQTVNSLPSANDQSSPKLLQSL